MRALAGIGAIAWTTLESVSGQTAADRRFTTCAEVKALSPADARRGWPVDIEGTLTFTHPDGPSGWDIHFVQDATDGIYVSIRSPSPDLAFGQRVRIQGVTGPGDFAPVILKAQAHILADSGPLPAPARPSLWELQQGEFDSRWATVTGTARAVAPSDSESEVVLELVEEDKRFPVILAAKGALPNPDGFLGARLQVTGVCAALFNKNRQVIGFRFFAPSPAHVKVLTPGVADPFSTPAVDLSEILQFSRAPAENPWTHVRGAVTALVDEKAFYIGDDDGGLLVQTARPTRPSVGTVVHAAGFQEVGAFSPVLADARVRITTEREPATEALSVTVHEALSGAHDSRLIALEARLIDVSPRQQGRALTFQSGAVVFEAHLPPPSPSWPSLDDAPGSLMRAAGVCRVTVDAAKNPTSFRLYPRGPEDLRVLKAPSWWTWGNTLAVIGGLLSLTCLTGAWGVALQRRVKWQTQRIHDAYEQRSAVEKRYRDLCENALDVIFSLDRQGRFTRINKLGEELLGYPQKEASRLNILDLANAPDAKGAATVCLDDIVTRPGDPPRELRLKRKNARPRVLELSLRATTNSAGAREYDGIARDVTDRKDAEAALAVANKELVETSRQAGMAEVATGVLHNVGNVLNSVNVAAKLALDRARLLKTDRLRMAADLLTENQDEDRFLTAHEKGKQLPAYFSQLATHFQSGQENLEKELKTLQDSLGHVNDIVAMQQTYAKIGAHWETVSPESLIEDALKLNASALARHDIRLIREFEPTKSVRVDRPKALQSLVNLLRNAKHSCDERNPEAKEIRVGLSGDADQVRITIADNGVGIPAENLTKIFSYGFTTRPTGHGFGLHSSALAIKELGGRLDVQSDGPGRGAVFTVSLPAAEAQTRHEN